MIEDGRIDSQGFPVPAKDLQMAPEHVGQVFIVLQQVKRFAENPCMVGDDAVQLASLPQLLLQCGIENEQVQRGQKVEPVGDFPGRIDDGGE